LETAGVASAKKTFHLGCNRERHTGVRLFYKQNNPSQKLKNSDFFFTVSVFTGTLITRGCNHSGKCAQCGFRQRTFDDKRKQYCNNRSIFGILYFSVNAVVKRRSLNGRKEKLTAMSQLGKSNFAGPNTSGDAMRVR